MSLTLIDKTDKTIINMTASMHDASLAQLARIATEALRDETQQLKDSVDGTITTIQNIVTDFENVTAPGAVSDVNTARDNAITAINNARQTAIDAIGDEQVVAIGAVNQAADTAIGIINGLVAQAEAARDLSQAWAEGTEPGGVGTKSSKEHAEDAEVSATAAGVSETNALASEQKAEKWAEEDEDVEVEVGKYSAKHHAAKAQTFANEFLTAETVAYTVIVEADGGWVQDRWETDELIRELKGLGVYSNVAFLTNYEIGGAKV